MLALLVRNVWQFLRIYGLLTIGALLLALANDLFLIPNNVFSGGATGLALVINSYTGLPVGFVVLLLNVPLVLAGVVWLGGWRFLARTTYAVVAYALLLDGLRPYFPQPLSSDPLLFTLYGGLLGGAGVGLVFRAQGTTGGDDIGAQLLNRFKGIPVNSGLVLINAGILLVVGLRFGPEKGLYALISAFASSKAVDFILDGLRPARLIYIISAAPDEITHRIQETTGRGVTFLQGQGAYTGRDHRVLLTVVRQQEVPVVVELVRGFDPDAFIIINDAREVLGQGFRPIPTRQVLKRPQIRPQIRKLRPPARRKKV